MPPINFGSIVPLSAYPLVQNARCYTPGRIQSRPPLLVYTTLPVVNPIHSIRRLNNSGPFATSTRIVGSGPGLYFGTTTLSVIELGYSGNPLSLIPFEPPSTPDCWMYVMDSIKGGRKVNVFGTAYQQGIAPPLNPPTAVIGPTSYSIIDLFNGATVGFWLATGTALALTPNPTGALSTTIGIILYGSGSPTRASITPPLGQPGAFITIGSGATQETDRIYATDVAPSPSTIASIAYASGTTGLCTIVAAAGSFTLPNGIIMSIGAGGTQEYALVISYSKSSTGANSFTCITQFNHVVGENLTPEDTTQVFTSYPHSAGETVTAGYFAFQVTTGTGLVSESAGFDLSIVQNRPQQTSDIISIFVWIDVPGNVSSFQVLFDVDPSINNFTANYYTGTYDISGLTPSTFGKIELNIGSFIRTGSSDTSWADIKAVGIRVVATGTVNVRIADFDIEGTYGPDPGSAGADYEWVYRYRSSVTGAVSNPSPANRPAINPGGESVVVTGESSPDPQVDTADFFRLGGVLTSFVLVGSSPCTSSIIPQIVDDYMDIDLASSEVLQTDNDQPFTVPGVPVSGMCNANGFSVTWVSGGTFDSRWPQGTGIIINGVPTSLYQQPFTAQTLSVNDALGVLTNVPFQVPQPVLLGQSMQTMFGIYGEGNAGITLFGVGNDINPGTIFWTNGNNADAAAAANNLPICSPSEALMNGGVFADQPFAFSIKRLFRLVPNFQADANGNPIGGFLAYDEGSGYGLFAPWAMCVGPRIYFRAIDGIRESVLGGSSQSITDPDISLLFPHGESAGVAVQIGTVVIYPPDDTQPAKQQLSWANSHLFFDYVDTQGSPTTLVWNPVTRTWSMDTSGFGVATHYLDEAQSSNTTLVGGNDGNIYKFDSTSPFIDQQFQFRMPVRGDQGTYLCCRDLYLGAALVRPSTVIVNVDGVDYTITTQSTAGAGYQRIYYNLPDIKGQAWSWGFISNTAAEIYLKDTQANMKNWAGAKFSFSQPYRDLMGETKP